MRSDTPNSSAHRLKKLVKTCAHVRTEFYTLTSSHEAHFMKLFRPLFVAALCLSMSVACSKKAEDNAPADQDDAAIGQEEQAEGDAADDADDAAAAAAAAQDAEDDGPTLNAEDPKAILDSIEGEGDLYATFVTSKGEINCALFEDEVPTTVANFVGLATGAKQFEDPKDQEIKEEPFYDGTIFHRVIPDFMIQGGDRLGRGVGGPGYKFEDEFNPELRHDSAGTLSMANSGPNTNGSQFFITDAPTPHLDDRHSVFGKCEDTDVVSQIASVERGAQDKPNEDVVLESVKISRKAAE